MSDRYKTTIISLMMFLAATAVQGQINISGKVYGGARQADVGGSTFINIGADNCDVIIDAVYGGNDISGNIGASATIPTKTIFTEAIANGVAVANEDAEKDGKNTNGYNSFIRTNVEASGKHLFIGNLFGGGYGNYKYTKYTSGEYIDKYKVESWDVTWDEPGGRRTLISEVVANLPTLGKAYLELCGGTFGYVYGGGDSVTVSSATDICIDNTSTRTKINGESGGLTTLDTDRLKNMGINTEYYNKIANHDTDVDKFLFSRVFGGNNKADMRIIPKWHLKSGSIENLYSGGNEGRMTSETGILLEIGTGSNINVYNVYGGCRKADVCPETSPGNTVPRVNNITGYSFPDNLAARVLVRSGKIHNVYGGNDVRGRVYFGNAVGVYTSISGDVYGGGNGSYPYTDNDALANDLIYSDFYYNPIEVLDLKDGLGNPLTSFTQAQSVEALNAIRPNAEQVSIRIADNDIKDDMSSAALAAALAHPVIIGGSVYCGGNSATLKMDPNHSSLSANYPLVELKIGSNIIVDNVFLGNNGANMVDQSDGGLLEQYGSNVTPAAGGDPVDFSTLDFTQSNIFAEYMKGCALDIIPSVNFDDKATNHDPATYRDYSAYIGSFYCGGNVGSMTYNDVKPMNFNRKFIIFDKLVGGCNNAIIPLKTGVNAYYEGGLTGTPNATTDNKVELILAGIRIEPKRWTTDGNGKKNGLEWNTIDGRTGAETPAILTTEPYDEGKDYITSSTDDLNRRFQHGHVYGGCYSSGIVNGNVVINIDSTLIERDKLFDVVKTDELGEEESLYGDDQTKQEQFKILKRNTGVLLGQQGMDVLGAALNVFGGGKGKGTEIWGSTTINLNGGYTFQIFGGSEEGVIGKPDDGTGDDYTYSYKLKYIGTDAETSEITKTYKYNSKYSCYVNLCGKNAGVSKQDDTSEDMAQCEFMYGGGFLGPICGNTYVNLGKGRIFNSFAGSCNADILGHAETYIGRMVRPGTNTNPYLYKNALSIHRNDADYYETYYTEGFPWIRDYTYGGNDLGGRIMQAVDFSDRVRETGTGEGAFNVRDKVHRNNATEVLKANAYTEYWQGRAEGIFGGCYGTYDYTDEKFRAYFKANGDPQTDRDSKPFVENAIVNFRPTYSQANNKVNKIFGAGQGYPGEKDRDHLQDRSYVLIDIPQEMTYYKEMEVFGAGAWGGVGMRTVIWPNLTPTAAELKDLDGHSTIIDLVRGQIGAAYGGSYEEGITRRTVVNVPSGSTIVAGSIFGGAYGTKTLPSCDVLDSNVEYHSADAVLIYDPNTSALYQGSLYGGNNNERRTLSTYVNVDVPVVQKKVIQYDKEVSDYPKGYVLWSNGTVYGAGRGENTWAEYTMVDLKDGAKVWEVYGGGQMGHVLNAQTVQKYMQIYKSTPSPDIDPSEYEGVEWATAWQKAWTMDQYFPNETYDPTNEKFDFDHYAEFIATKLSAIRPRTELDSKTAALLGGSGGDKTFFNTNVIINEGATVLTYAYGGGLGNSSVPRSGDVWGTTYIALLGGTVSKDLYAAGTSGNVSDAFSIGSYNATTNPLGFTASSNAYIKGGTARNIYGGGWEGSVGLHDAYVTRQRENSDGEMENYKDYLSTPYKDDIPGETYVVIGDPDGTSFTDGIPAIERNAYGGGEGGAVWGTTNTIMRNGYIGYRYLGYVAVENGAKLTKGSVYYTSKNGTGEFTAEGTEVADGTNYFEIVYQEKLNDETWTKSDSINRLYDSGCIFGGGYIDNSSVDNTFVKMYGGHVRNALFGGGEIAAVGRGVIQASGIDKSVRTLSGIYKAGKTRVELFDGYVHRNVFGGGRGYNNLGENGKLYSDGYVFGQTEVHIHGGQVGTIQELANGNGNVFGGGDIGYVYSAYELEDGTLRRGIKDQKRYVKPYEGYYYEHIGKKKDGTTDETGTNISGESTPEPPDYTSGVYTDASGFIMYPGKERKLTEDCKVLVEPHCKVTAAGGATFRLTYNIGDIFTVTDLDYLREYNETHTPVDIAAISSLIDVKGKVETAFTIDLSYRQGEYVPTFALNSLGNKNDGNWEKLEANTNDDGVIILNAVFAGGNTSSGSSKAYANATSVFGNATASIHDIYHRDLISIGRGQTGGLYGDGNLTFVDGYRGLNITNYGTDYNYLYGEGMRELTYDGYLELLNREQDYYEIRYKCVKACIDKDGTSYHTGVSDGFSSASTLSGDQIMALFKDVFDENTHEYTYRIPSDDGYEFYNSDGSINTNTNPAEGPLGYWVQNGVCSIYAGRLMNTIQRADFCGVFGSRMVMKGAEDRVPEIVDYTNYTINRVREVSLNKKKSIITSDTGDEASHGNYFGIYNIVNYLGALTSDFDFGDQGTDSDEDDAAGKPDSGFYTGDTSSTGGVRTSDNTRTDEYSPDYEGQTFYGWKRAHHDEQKRNNGNSHNKVALASGVYLELTTEESTGKEFNEKVWGPITGVVELDLINVQPGIGGGFVYAKNVHGKRTPTDHINTTLTALNAGAVTQWDFDYSTTEDNVHQRQWQTSGNFVHSTQTIIDDCYNVSGKYMGSDKVPAHYWYIKGKVYVYDQYISAYTGISNAYTEMVDIPLTISAASNGTMTLLQVKPNKYAYKNTSGAKLEEGKKIIINDVEYYLNDPINYWDWYKLTPSEQALFVDETYVISDSCKIGDNWYAPGYVMLKPEYESFRNAIIYKASKDATGENNVLVYDKDNNPIVLAYNDVFHLSNNLSHDTGYMLTYKVNNPVEWNTWYTKEDSPTHEKQQTEAVGYHNGPTFYLTNGTGTLLGQRSYEVSDLISKETYDIYQGIKNNENQAISSSIPNPAESDPNYEKLKQATFEKAYILIKEETVTESGVTHHLQKGHVVSESDKTRLELGGSVVDAYVCTQSIQISPTRFIYVNSKMTEDEKDAYIKEVNDTIKHINTALKDFTYDELNAITDLSGFGQAILSQLTKAQQKELSTMLSARSSIIENVVEAYYCTEPGLYGGNYYEGGKNYRGLEVFSSMTETDRNKFTFNYDALDLLVDPTFGRPEGQKYQYDGLGFTTRDQAKTNPAGYSIEAPVDYTATYNGNETDTYNGVTLSNGAEYSRTQFESLPNERRHYAPITVKAEDVAGGKTYTVYVVKSPDLVIGNEPYAVGSTISAANYTDDLASYVTPLTFTAAGTYYYCRESYEIGEKDNGAPVKAVMANTGVCAVGDTKTNGQTVPVGFIISENGDDSNYTNGYKSLVNKQLNFTIHGKAPTETSTFYVSRFSDIKDLSTEKIITVIYRYDYEESDKLGNHITPVSERHVVNIHITFKSGLPEVADIKAPQIVLPGDYVGLREPNVIPGATEITGGGWELYERQEDAESRTNAIPFTPTIDPLYWYQNDYYVRYYCLTNIGGKSYSNAVQVSVANYHDLKKVMEAKTHHYYIDHVNVDRDPKIYIKDYSSDATGSKSGLDLLKDLFNLSIGEALDGHEALNTSQVGACKNLEFILKSNLSPENPWTPIGKDVQDDPETPDVDESLASKCFDGVLHGDGYTITGLTQSLFSHLCGSVYNLGVTGSFTTAGVVDNGDGYVESCWINTTGTPDADVRAVFGNPTATSGYKQIVNSYYQEGKTYKTTDDGSHGLAKAMSDRSFYNGEVAYNLNDFYLYKRYCDKEVTSGSGTEYYYYDGEVDPITKALVPKTKYYANNPDLCSSGYVPADATPSYVVQKYVEDRFADGDFIYSAGSIPGSDDKRLHIDPTTGKPNYYPVWPEDYLFFGQTLDYGFTSGRTHQDVPSRYSATNRVLRAPAYFRSSEMSVAHFNPDAVVAGQEKLTFEQINDNVVAREAYPRMTAIDFTGYNDIDRNYDYQKGWSTWSKTSQLAQSSGMSIDAYAFYPPLLDDGVVNEGLNSFTCGNLTRNLLVYTNAPGGTGIDEKKPTASQRTANAVSGSDGMKDAAYDDHKTVNSYNTETVKSWDESSELRGHWVRKSDSGTSYIATLDHFLVDKEDFNAPMAYTFTEGNRMWHQRWPDNYVNLKKGWEGISLPFTVEIVTTNDKGEITHFYKKTGSTTYDDNYDSGHEYWLREFSGIDDANTPIVANLVYPALTGDGSVIMSEKEVENTFLWDYYYNGFGHSHKDKNQDVYQTYYETGRTYPNYPLLTSAVPYIIGFPGKTYYEFDLSGDFAAGTTSETKPVQLGKQVITFASPTTGITIGVSDFETVKKENGTEAGVTHGGYTFKPCYLNSPDVTKNANGDPVKNGFPLNADGDSFVENITATTVDVAAFRPYFEHAKPSPAPAITRSIMFSNISSQLGGGDEQEPQDNVAESMEFYAKKHKIVVTSHMQATADVAIFNVSGMCIASFDIEPGETIETPVNNGGVYIVRAAGGHYTKKISMK